MHVKQGDLPAGTPREEGWGRTGSGRARAGVRAAIVAGKRRNGRGAKGRRTSHGLSRSESAGFQSPLCSQLWMVSPQLWIVEGATVEHGNQDGEKAISDAAQSTFMTVTPRAELVVMLAASFVAGEGRKRHVAEGVA